MNLNKKNLFARYYNWIYENYPNDICSFFWSSIWIILLFPFFVIGRLSYFGKTGWDYSADHSLGRGFAFWIAYFLMLLVGQGIMSKFGYNPVGFSGFFLLAPIIGIVIMSVFAGVFIGITAGGVYLYENRKDKPRKTPVRDWIGAIRGKYCTR